MRCGNTVTTNFFINGNCLYSSGHMNNMYMNSCFMPMFPPPTFAGVAGYSCGTYAPALFNMIGKGLSWLGKDVIAPAATFAWNKVIAPAATFVWDKAIFPAYKFMRDNVFKPTGKFINEKILKPAKNGVSKLWNKIFHKKSKSV